MSKQLLLVFRSSSLNCVSLLCPAASCALELPARRLRGAAPVAAAPAHPTAGFFWGTSSTLNTLQQMTFPHRCLCFKMDSIAGVFFFFSFCLNWHSMFYLLQEAEIICITFGLPTSNYIHPFVLLACWSWKCNLLLFCLRCCINYWILPCFISSEPGSCCGCSKQVFCTFICFTFNTEVVFSADCEKWQGHLGFFGCWVRDCFDPGNEFKWKYSIYKRITCRSTSTGAQFGVMVKPQKQPSGEVCHLQSSTWN